MKAWLGSAIAIVAFVVTPVEGQVTTSQYNNQRTGAVLDEVYLAPGNVNVSQFGKLGAFKVDGAVYAQPLFVPAVDIPGKGKHDVVFVATEHDSVYAFDSTRPNDGPLWHVSFLDKKRGLTTVPAPDVLCQFIQPEVGITATPVIDITTGTLYVLARTMSDPTFGDRQYFQYLHALAITTGVEKFGGPKLITASVPGRGDDSRNGQLRFDPLLHNPRAALSLVKNTIYLAWASSCDVGPYHGWLMAYDPQTLEQRAVRNVTPDGIQGGIWASDTGLAADDEGNIFVPTANGTFDASSGGRDYGDSVLKVRLQGSSIAIRDYFTPYNQARLSQADADLGSSGPMVIPDQRGPHPHLLVQPTKGPIYLIDRDRLGGFHSEGDAVLDRLLTGGGGYGAMAYWNGHLFFACNNDFLRDYTIVHGRLILNRYSQIKFEYPGASPSVSANGKQNAMVWTVATKTWNDDSYEVLYAFNARSIDNPIYTSEQNAKRDRAGLATRFVIPIVVNGRVYFGARGEVEMYGLIK